jgi:glutamate carboxypeptidase
MERLQTILAPPGTAPNSWDLRVLVNLDCGTSNKAGVDAAGRIFRQRLERAGALMEEFPLETYGNCLMGTWRGNGRARILLSGHLDTVYPDGTAAARPMRTEGKHILGPGVSDMKSGLLAGLYAIRALQRVASRISPRSISSPIQMKKWIACPPAASTSRWPRNGRCPGPGGSCANVILSARKGCRLPPHRPRSPGACRVEPEKGANAILRLAR